MTKLSFSWLLLALLVSQTQVCGQEIKTPVQIQTTVQTPVGSERQAAREAQEAAKPLPLMESPKKVQFLGPQPLRTNRKKIELECGLPPALPKQANKEFTPEEALLPWRADCQRRIRRRWENNSAQHSICTVKLKEDGSAQWIKVEKSDNEESGKNAAAVIQLALPLRKAPNELPYTGTLKIEFLDYPNLNLRIEK